jgi:hypothetical protein
MHGPVDDLFSQAGMTATFTHACYSRRYAAVRAWAHRRHLDTYAAHSLANRTAQRDTFAAQGPSFLFIYWPSFNSGPAGRNPLDRR